MKIFANTTSSAKEPNIQFQVYLIENMRNKLRNKRLQSANKYSKENKEGNNKRKGKEIH